ncbi:MAG TPA: hypothetical protein VNW98_07250 [Burkholderiaceae bacterium]|jgi:hypothetical protein|nr:hypothetical protein [Burkholderiaceae bacterium]
MKVVSRALHKQSGVVSPFMVGFTGLAGFAAGALLAGTVLSAPAPAPSAGDWLRVPVASSIAQDMVRVEPISTFVPDRLAVAGPWPFESATPASAGAPGKKRPDRLSAPEGWTYEADARTE